MKKWDRFTIGPLTIWARRREQNLYHDEAEFIRSALHQLPPYKLAEWLVDKLAERGHRSPAVARLYRAINVGCWIGSAMCLVYIVYALGVILWMLKEGL